MSKRLSKKEKTFVKAYVETGNGTQSALKAYDTDSAKVASVIAAENLAKPRIQVALQEALPDELLSTVHLEGLNAGRRVGDEIEPDFTVRAKYLDMGYKIKGSYAAEKHINLNLDGTPTERSNELGDRLLGLLRH